MRAIDSKSPCEFCKTNMPFDIDKQIDPAKVDIWCSLGKMYNNTRYCNSECDEFKPRNKEGDLLDKIFDDASEGLSELISNNKLTLRELINLINLKNRELGNHEEIILDIKYDEEGNIMTVQERLKKVIAEQSGVAEKDITPKSNFTKDLGMDSLDLIELVMSMEKEFSVELPDEDAEKLKTVQDALDYLEDKGIE